MTNAIIVIIIYTIAQTKLNGFNKKIGYYGQEYYSFFLVDREITLDDLSGTVTVCVCTLPEKELIPGEVIDWKSFDGVNQAVDFIHERFMLK